MQKQVPFGALSVFCLGAAFLGVGVHKWNLDEEKSERAMMVCSYPIYQNHSPPTTNPITNLPHQKWFFFFEIFFCIAIIPIKLSISLMLMRVAGPKKNYTYALWGMASLFILANTISFLYILLRCTPISFAWNTTTPGGSCLPSRDLADVYYADTAVNILTDWFCALM